MANINGGMRVEVIEGNFVGATGTAIRRDWNGVLVVMDNPLYNCIVDGKLTHFDYINQKMLKKIGTDRNYKALWQNASVAAFGN